MLANTPDCIPYNYKSFLVSSSICSYAAIYRFFSSEMVQSMEKTMWK